MKTSAVILFMLYFLLAGCTVYMPQPVPICLMSARNQVQLSGGFTIIPGIAGSAAYSPVNHLAVQVYGFAAPDQIHNYQAATGYYWNKGADLNLEVYGGLAGGEGKLINTAIPASYKGNYRLYFAQFNLGQQNQGKKHIDYGFGLKTGLFDAHTTDDGFYERNAPNPVQSRHQYILLEPAAFFRTGSEKFKTGFQLNGASLINAGSKQNQIPYHTGTLGITLNYFFSTGKISR